MKVALIHDFLNVLGGAERVLKSLSKIYPEAPIYTLFVNRKNIGDFLSDKKIVTSSLQKKAEFLGFRNKYLLPFLAKAVEEFDFKDYDVVISSQSAWTKGIITKPETIHISYCHTPTRFLWTESSQYLNQHHLDPIRRYFVKKMLYRARIWDMLASDRVDYYLANSKITQKRIKKYYRQDSKVIYPPVNIEKFSPSLNKKDYFLIVSRLSPYKQIDLAVKAFNQLGLPLIIVGEGEQKKELQQMAKSNIKITGYLSDKEMVKYYQEARALIFPTFDEDFGLTPVEAQSCGTGVIAAGRGGSTETIIEGKTGEFFRKATPKSLIKAVERFINNEKKYKPDEIITQAEKFSENHFIKNIKEFVGNAYKKGI